MVSLRKGIYKDTVKSSDPAAEVQFRPNVCIAISLSPELFTY